MRLYKDPNVYSDHPSGALSVVALQGGGFEEPCGHGGALWGHVVDRFRSEGSLKRVVRNAWHAEGFPVSFFPFGCTVDSSGCGRQLRNMSYNVALYHAIYH